MVNRLAALLSFLGVVGTPAKDADPAYTAAPKTGAAPGRHISYASADRDAMYADGARAPRTGGSLEYAQCHGYPRVRAEVRDEVLGLPRRRPRAQ